LNARINKASYELSLKNKFNRIIINDQLERACKEAEEAVREFLAPTRPSPLGKAI
jgi:guanylate kinase